MIFSILLLALITAERLGELALSHRNTRRLEARGAYEVASGHYPLIIALHAAWLAGLWWLAWNRPANLPMAALFIPLEAVRVWVFTSLGERWTTRIVVVPGAPLVRSGPYRFFAHPNYAVVFAEVALLPLVFGLWQYALVFTLLNAPLLGVRMRAEDRALSSLPAVRRERSARSIDQGGGV